MRLAPLEPLVSHRAQGNYQYWAPYPDPGSMDGRAVQFGYGTVFVGRGQFWHQDDRGAVSGPF